MKTRETIYVRGPKVLLQDFAWLVGLCQELITAGDSEERMRFVACGFANIRKKAAQAIA